MKNFLPNQIKKTKKLIKRFLLTLKFSIYIIPIILILLGFMSITHYFQILILGKSQPTNSTESVLCEKVSEDRKIYELEIENYEQLIPHTSWILAQVCQESGGKGTDPMQASEYYCGSIGCINNKELSIEVGIKFLNELYQKVLNMGFEDNFETVLQSYNFGTGYLDFLKSRNELKTNQDLAELYSIQMCGTAGTSIGTAVNENKYACYGDYKYIEHVLRYKVGKFNGKFSPIYRKENIFLTQMYGMTSFAVNSQAYGVPFHNGIDLASDYGSSLYAVAEGTVIKTENHLGGYGNWVLYQIAEDMFILYAHLDSVNVVEGDKVNPDTIIGTQGNSGNSGGTHLHLSIFKNSDMEYLNTINPLDIISDKYTKLPGSD